MGTNFYVHEKICEHCNRYEEIHIGKRSLGWMFSFQYNGGEYYKNIKEMKEWLRGKRIFDEYGEENTYKEFWDMVDEKQKTGKRNHAKKFPGNTEKVIGGYSFSDCDFC